MKRPSFQFYPGDWQANSNLRRCTHAEKGAWLDVMCLLHDQPEYGQLRWPLKEIAQAIGASLGLVRGLVTKGVLKGDDKHALYKFLTDEQTAGDFKGEIGWNFTKFLVDKNGNVFARFASRTTPEDEQVTAAIEKALAAK